ncbi:MAG: 4Fe-4S binding protein [Eubacteriales bacterium]
MLTKEQIREKAAALHIDAIGFASRDRFEALPPERSPLYIFPDAASVILIGRRILRGTLRGVEEKTTLSPYGSFGRWMLDDQFVSAACYDLVRFIEDDGYEACPIFPNPAAINNMGVPVEPGLPAPNVAPDFDYAAVACGLGEIGQNGAVLTPGFGHRLRFQMIITDLPLESDPLYAGEPLCDGCGKCAEACPLHALDLSRTRTREICGRVYKIGTFDDSLCRACSAGGGPNRLHPKGEPDRLGAACTRACAACLAARGIGRG